MLSPESNSDAIRVLYRMTDQRPASPSAGKTKVTSSMTAQTSKSLLVCQLARGHTSIAILFTESSGRFLLVSASSTSFISVEMEFFLFATLQKT